MQVQTDDSLSANVNSSQFSFKKPKKLIGRKRAAEEDIVSILESIHDTDGKGGLGTRE
jgi:hypothetical protein